MIKALRRLVFEEEGQGMVEYGLIIGLITVTVIVLVRAIGTHLYTIFGKAESELAGAAKETAVYP